MAFPKIASLGVLIALASILSSCGPSENEKLKAENEELRSQVSQLQEKVSDTESAAEKVKTDAEELKVASDDLQTELTRFESENWRDVVPDAKAAG